VPFVYLYTFLKIEYLHGFSFLWHRSTQECESRSHLLEYVRMTFWDHKIKKMLHTDGNLVDKAPFQYLDTIFKIEYLHGFSFVPQKFGHECQSRSHLLEYVRMTFGANKKKPVISYWWKVGW
jgi:hypothetical protein